MNFSIDKTEKLKIYKPLKYKMKGPKNTYKDFKLSTESQYVLQQLVQRIPIRTLNRNWTTL